MPRKKRTILQITPQTHVRATQGDRIFWQIPEDKLFPNGLKRKRRLEQYNDYRENLFKTAKAKNFIMPQHGAHLVFYLPVPKSWRPGRKAATHLLPHQSKPDLDNLIKAFKDALLVEDKEIWNYQATKLWTNSDQGYIEIATK